MLEKLQEFDSAELLATLAILSYKVSDSGYKGHIEDHSEVGPVIEEIKRILNQRKRS